MPKEPALNTATSRLSSRSLWVFSIGIALLLLSGLLYLSRPVSEEIALLGLAIIWVSLFPGLVHLGTADLGHIPFFPLIGVFYAVFFGLPVFLIELALRNEPAI